MKTLNRILTFIGGIIAFATAGSAAPAADQPQQRHYMIVAAEGLPKESATAMLKQSFLLLLEQAQPGDRVELVAAPGMTKLADVVVPPGSMRTRANSPVFAGKFGQWQKLLSVSSIGDQHRAGQLAMPELADEIARSCGRAENVTVICCGTPLFMSSRPAESPFDMVDGLVPNDATITALSSQSVFGTADRKQQLQHVTVHWIIPDEQWVISDAHKRAVFHFWTAFFGQMGCPVCFASTADAAFARAIQNDSSSVLAAALNLQDRTIRMERIPEFRAEQATAPVPMAVEIAAKAPVKTASPMVPRAEDIQLNPPPGPSPAKPDEAHLAPAPAPKVVSEPKRSVSLDVIVQDRAGRVVSGLAQNDFTVFENGTQQELTGFAYERTPVSVVLLLDVSGSMSAKLKRVRAAAQSIIRQGYPGDEWEIFTFTTEINCRQPFTTDAAAAERALDHLSAGGGTRLLDAVQIGIQSAVQSHNKTRVLVLVTDGGEEDSLITRSELLAAVRAGNVEVVSLGFPEGLNQSQPGDLRHGSHPINTEALAKRLLDEVSATSGGRAFYPKRTEELDQIAEAIISELRSPRYRLTYYSTREDNNGEWRDVHVEVKASPERGPMTARARAGYFASVPQGHGIGQTDTPNSAAK